MADLRDLLERFVRGEDRSLAAAGRIEAALASRFPEDERFEELTLALASYRPGGGEYLYDEERILPLCRRALERLDP